MFDKVETLLALYRHETMGRAAEALRITQSSVSKRLKALEAEVGFAVLAKDGRNVVFTEAGVRLVERLNPLVMAVRDELQQASRGATPALRIGLAESLMASWASQPIATFEEVVGVRLEPFSHRGPTILERLRAGSLNLGLISGRVSGPSDLVEEPLGNEAMVLLNAGRLSPNSPCWTIEPSSLTWAAIERSVAKQFGHRQWRTLQTFTCVAQFALASGNAGLVSLGVCRALHIEPRQYEVLTDISRPVALVYRPSLKRRPGMEALLAQLASRFKYALAKLAK